jgi:hypothetical protein
MSEEFGGFEEGGGDSGNVVSSQPQQTTGAERLKLPDALKGSPDAPPLFIDNVPVAADLGTSAFGKSIAIQHTNTTKTACCACCTKQVAYMPHEYAIAKGPASSDSEVLLTGEYKHEEKCGCCGLCYALPVKAPCYKDLSSWQFANHDQSKSYTIKMMELDPKAKTPGFAVITGESGPVGTIGAEILTPCQKCCKACCSEEFEEYPMVIYDHEGNQLFTKRTSYIGLCFFLKCKCCPCCGPKEEKPPKEEKQKKKCCGCCIVNDEGESVWTCCGICGKSGICTKICGPCLLPCCGGDCCKSGTWVEPIEFDEDDEWLGASDDTSGNVVARIHHHMFVEKSQKCCCLQSAKLSEVYYSQIDLLDEWTGSASDYGEGVWAGLMGYTTAFLQPEVTLPIFGAP